MMNSFTLTISTADLDHLRLMLREQLVGDQELIRDLLAQREPPLAAEHRLSDVAARLAFVERLAVQAGGLY